MFEYPNLETIGMKLVEKCGVGGLSLALKTLGILLQRKFSENEWVKILETDLRRLPKGDSSNNYSVLRMSYLSLPSNLKHCFAYYSIFPKGYEFENDGLIKLWMTEGLLKGWEIAKNEEELGNKFFNDLVSMSFFQKSAILPFWAGKCYFIVHDLINDLMTSMLGEFRLRIEGVKVQDIPQRTCHIWCCLDLEDELAEEIGNLKLMRYLDLSYTEITSLPNSICMLYNLHTLLLEECFKPIELPSNFRKLINLCHLNLKGTHIKKCQRR
ncbi:putative P-loop containing nucleoside triphosphate hydrolase, leucine-rich repeat domain, L [Medicago truncatula]|uniref:Putative P-loop containing nucleoside triphosphate hydrolase, leucine-rich repeat domain, L n=1 Tax=Medicago truncatula TaxID=3880 RepID=A0A396JUU6_MEDTR|nr:putative P-loop containing nucleoside triphosphate hydrolase, leucine-rich repeat domain, L [Medicago truncatula]